MPFTLSALISGHANPFASRSPPSPTSRRKLYFPPGGHTHDRHSIPPEQLHISLSDPVLVAAERRLSDVPNKHWSKKPKRLIPKDAGTIKTVEREQAILRLNGGNLPQSSGASGNTFLATESGNLLTTINNIRRAASGRRQITGFRGTRLLDARLQDPPADLCDISEVMTIVTAIDGSPDDTDASASVKSRYGSHLAPLASETFKEELYCRGYLKRPANRSSVARMPRTSLRFVSHEIFPDVLGRHQGRKIAECLRVVQGQVAADIGGELDSHFPEKQLSTSVVSVTLRVPRADGLESPETGTSTSASESFDLHEFSYLTAFTTPPSSPSIVIGAEMLKKGVNIGDNEHEVQRGAVP